MSDIKESFINKVEELREEKYSYKLYMIHPYSNPQKSGSVWKSQRQEIHIKAKDEDEAKVKGRAHWEKHASSKSKQRWKELGVEKVR